MVNNLSYFLTSKKICSTHIHTHTRTWQRSVCYFCYGKYLLVFPENQTNTTDFEDYMSYQVKIKTSVTHSYHCLGNGLITFKNTCTIYTCINSRDRFATTYLT
jgi:hypothetical protein